MEIITGYTETSNVSALQTFTSSEAAPDDVINLTGLPASLPNCSVGVQMFDAGQNIIIGSAGEFTIEVRTVNSMQYEDPGVASISATAPTTKHFTALVEGIKISAIGVAGITTWKVILTCSQ